jgi:transketolase
MTIELKSTRDATGEVLPKLGLRYRNLVVLDADLSASTKSSCFAERFPHRFFDVGCAEQNMMGLAAGLALSGKIAVACSYAVFASGRGWEQIRNVIAHDNLDVKVVVSHAGLTNDVDGSSHQALEDIALMRVIPNMHVIVPADYFEAQRAIETAVASKGPFYVRLSRSKTPVVFDAGCDFKLGRVAQVRDGDDVCIFSCGVMVPEALDAAAKLGREGVSARVVDVSTVKPMDVKGIEKHARETGCFVTAEEHNIQGGMGSAVSEVLRGGFPVEMVGVRDRFGQSGSVAELMREYALTSADIQKAAKAVLKRRR